MVGKREVDKLLFLGYLGGKIEKSWGLFWNKEEMMKLQMTLRSLGMGDW